VRTRILSDAEHAEHRRKCRELIAEADRDREIEGWIKAEAPEIHDEVYNAREHMALSDGRPEDDIMRQRPMQGGLPGLGRRR